ncbi:hypothetical protein RBS60_01740 [Sinomonas sp. ASV486]|uniref:Uncharacterized protein n=1 Tax=Sinomonas puerhi TaxID=3238584 RepID=A0AB39L1G1_9MICC|nr:hypothetical protein [Sinomonas sp. ASV486]MDQ4488915.1 hypothetical protein [Sinomonas sp. ASV486]
MSITKTSTRPSAGEASVLPQPPAERYIPKVTHIDPDFAVRADRHENRGGWAARIPVLNWFIAR